MTQKYTCLLLVCFVVFSSGLYAQTPAFTADVNAGCSPLAVTFTNTSTGFSPTATYLFNYGEGGGNINFPTAAHTYINEQSYNATLTVTDNGKTYMQNLTITVYKKPVVSFGGNVSKVCVNNSVNFTSTATAGDGTITDYLWDFGDGNTLDTTAATVSHTYTSASAIAPSLTVTNSHGCFASVSKPNLVTLLQAPKVSFTPDQTSVCNVADAVNFTNATTGVTPITYSWNFGDNATSTATNAAHSYGKKGTFGVKLLATSSEGCSDTSTTTFISVANSKSGITTSTLLCVNGSFSFTDSSSPQTAHPTWLLDGAVVASNVHQYSTAITDTLIHKLQLVNAYGNCTDTATRVVQALAAPLLSPFTETVTGYCNVPATAAFAAAGTGGVKWEWDFTNTVDSIFNPTAFTATPSFTYKAASTYFVKLRVTNATGCTSTVRQPVVIAKNTTAVSSTQGIYGCHTLPTTFKAKSTSPIAQYNWTFSDDNSTSTADTPQHVFSKIGFYTAFVKIKTTSGCYDTARLGIHIGDEPNFKFTVLMPADTLVCGNKIISFKVTGSPDSLIGAYNWSFGDAAGYVLLKTDSIFTHQYLTDGAFTVSLAINNHGCNDTIIKTNYINVVPPFAKISNVALNCNQRLKVAFAQSSIKARTYSWSFGDSTAPHTYDSTNIDTAVSHVFPGTGVYKTVLTTTNGQCVAKDSFLVRVLNKQTPSLTTQQNMLCENDTLHTLVSGMEWSPSGYKPAYTVKAVEYSDTTQHFGGVFTPYDHSGQNPFQINISKMSTGNKTLRLITASYGFNCLDTTNYVTVQINGPKAGFLIANNTPCLSDKVIFTDTSKGDGIAPIQSWKWLYGDSVIDTLTKGGNASHLYTNTGTYKIKLAVTDKNNCTDTAYGGNGITVKGPQAKFSIAQNPVLPNTPDTFSNLTDLDSAGRINNTYLWTFGDGSNAASNKDSISHSYKQYSDDTVTLLAKSSTTGCTNLATSIVHVKNVNLKFTFTSKFLTPNSTCPPVLVNFKNTSVNFSTVSWNFGDSLTANNINTPTHTYYKPGVYKVTIYGYYPNNTYDSSWDYVTVGGPSATLQASVAAGCGSKAVTFTAKPQNATSLIWEFGDGTASSDSVVTHIYTTPNVYTPSLTVNSGSECKFSYYLNTPIAIDSISITGIGKDSAIQCHQLLVNFIPKVFSIAKQNGKAISYSWQFGSGSATSTANDTAAFTYNKSGTYIVSVIATSPYGCTDTATTQVVYTDAHLAVINGLTEFCENTPVTFSAVKTNPADALTYNWNFGKDSSLQQNPPAQTFSATGNNMVTLIASKNGCTDTISQTLTVHAQPNVTLLVSDSVVCLGSSVLFDVKPLNNNSDTLSYFWNWGDGKDSAAVKSANFVYTANGTYPVLLRATSNFGCKEELGDTVVVSLSPNVIINAPVDICKNGSVTFTSSSSVASSTQYLWHFSDNTTSSKQNPELKTYTTAGINDVYLIASIGNCHDTAYHQLTVHDNPQVNLITSAQRVCFGDTVQLTAHNGKDYQWSVNNVVVAGANVASQHIMPVANTKYSVWAIDNYGCKNSDSLTVAVTVQQHLSVASPVVNVCAGSGASLSVSGTDNYNWIDGTDLNATNIANPATVDSAQNKTYTVVGSDAYGCFTDTAHIQVIVRNNPVIETGNNVNNITTPAGAPTQLSATSASNIVKWNWQPTLYLSCTNCESPISKPRQNIRYLAEGTDSYGCTGLDTISVTVVCKESMIGIPDVFSPNGDGRNDRFGVAGYGIKTIKHFVIFGRNGNKVFERNNLSAFDTNATWDGMCNNAYMPTGTYVYIIEAVCDAGEVYNVKGTVTLVR